MTAEVVEGRLASTPAAAARLEQVPAPPRPARLRFALRRVDPLSVFKVLAGFSLVGVPVAVLALAGLWFLATRAGVVAGLDGFLGDLFQVEDFRIEGTRLLFVAALAGYVLALVITVVAVAAAAVYNAAARLSGGVSIKLVEETATPPEAVEPADEARP